MSIFMVIRPAIFTDIQPPRERGELTIIRFSRRVNHPLCAQERAVRREPSPVARAFDDDLVAGVGQAIQSAVAQDGVIEEAQPFVHGPVAGDDEAGRPMPVEDEFVEVGGLLGGQAMETQVIEDEQVGGTGRYGPPSCPLGPGSGF